jgi:hypothetical protein
MFSVSTSAIEKRFGLQNDHPDFGKHRKCGPVPLEIIAPVTNYGRLTGWTTIKEP